MREQTSDMHRYSAKRTIVTVNFSHWAPKAKSVVLTGDFNQWNHSEHLMKRMPDGAWHLQLPMHSGHHKYLFLVDGTPHLDPSANGVTRDEKNMRVSLLIVS
ncbi:glycoside hydrolase family 13 [bacterium]|nr:glycoside hydrolase family 13 [bacterium]MDG1892108.1 glycoside hydrolase family 13 [Verrucomicrobiota bacterium]